MSSQTPPDDDERLYEIDHVVSIDPDSRTLRDVFRILDRRTDPPREFARTFDEYTAARVTAMLEAYDRMQLRLVNTPLRCPRCGAYETAVKDTRKTDQGLMRIRECSACSARFKTVERVLSVIREGDDV